MGLIDRENDREIKRRGKKKKEKKRKLTDKFLLIRYIFIEEIRARPEIEIRIRIRKKVKNSTQREEIVLIKGRPRDTIAPAEHEFV